MINLILLLILLLLTNNSYATLTVANVPVTKTGGSNPAVQDSDITDTGSNVGIGSVNPGQKLDVQGTVRLFSSGNLSIGSANPAGSIDVSTRTDSILLPTGTSGQQPASPVTGMMRFDSTYSDYEGYQTTGSTTSWRPLNGVYVICSNGNISATTSAGSETNLASCSIPAGMIGNNGGIEVYIAYSIPAANGNRTTWIRHSTTAGDTSAGTIIAGSTISTNTNKVIIYRVNFFNNNSQSSQQLFRPSSGQGEVIGQNTNVLITGTINTANTSYINFNCDVTSNLDSCGISFYKVVLYTNS